MIGVDFASMRVGSGCLVRPQRLHRTTCGTARHKTPVNLWIIRGRALNSFGQDGVYAVGRLGALALARA